MNDTKSQDIICDGCGRVVRVSSGLIEVELVNRAGCELTHYYCIPCAELIANASGRGVNPGVYEKEKH